MTGERARRFPWTSPAVGIRLARRLSCDRFGEWHARDVSSRAADLRLTPTGASLLDLVLCATTTGEFKALVRQLRAIRTAARRSGIDFEDELLDI